MVATATFSFDEQLHVYRDAEGIVRPSVTQALKANGLINFDHVPPHILEHKRQLGTLVHKAAELFDNGEDPADYDVPDEVAEYLEGYLTFRKDTGFFPSIVEARQLGEHYGMVYGMQPDRVGVLNNEWHVIELKCGAAAHPAWGVQLAAYCVGLYGGKSTGVKRAAVQLGRQFPRGYKLHPYDEASDFPIWHCALAQTTWLLNKALIKLQDVPERLIAA